ncbi:MAG: O-methyltransferase [Candidatus Bathyarchaeia archaeon]
MTIVNPNIERYLTDAARTSDKTLAEMEQFAASNMFPIVGPLVGRLLQQLTVAVDAKRILELGSGFGYSAYWFTKGLPPHGSIICTDTSKEHAKMAEDFFRKAGLKDKLKFLVGDALEILDKTPGTFDIIFNDVEKHQYPEVFRKAAPRLRPGGLFIADNVLWGGDILSKTPSATAQRILEFNRLLFDSNQFLTTILPLRDGVSISLRVA